MAPSFDTLKFFAALDVVRTERRMSWHAVSRETGVVASTFTRLRAGRYSLASTPLLRLCLWAGFSDITVFVTEPDGGLDGVFSGSR